MVEAIFKGLGTGTLSGLRQIISEEEAERRLSYKNFDERVRKNIDAINTRKPVVADYDTIIQRVADDIVAFNPDINPLRAYDYALSLDENFLKETNQEGVSVTNYKKLSDIFRKSNLGGGTQYQLLIDDPLDIGFSVKDENKADEIPSDDRSVFQKIFKNDPNYAAQEYGREYGIPAGEAQSLYGETPESATARYTLANVYRGDEESGPRGEFKRYGGEQFIKGGLTLRQATNQFQETIMVNSKKLKTFFGQDSFGAISITEGKTAPEYVQQGILYGNQVFGALADKNGSVRPGIVTEYANRVGEVLEYYTDIQDVYKALGRESETYKVYLNPDVTSEKTKEDILNDVDTALKEAEDLNPSAIKLVRDKLKNSMDAKEEYTEFRNGKVDTESVLAHIQSLPINTATMELLQSGTVKRPKEDTKYTPAEQAIIKNQIDSSLATERGEISKTGQDFVDTLGIDKFTKSGKLNIENIPGIGDLAENNPFITENSVDTSRDDTLNTEDNRDLTIGNRVDDAIETVSSVRDKIISARDAKVAASRIKTLNRNIKVQIAQGNTEKALELIDEANILARDVKEIFSTKEYKNITELAASLKPTEVAARYQGGFMTPRLNTGGTIGEIGETVVTGRREDEPNFNVRDSILFGSSGVQDNYAFDRDLKNSNIFENDAGYDEAYNYTQDMRDLENLNPTGKYRGQRIDKLVTKTKEKASEFLGEEIDKIGDLGKLAIKTQPLNLGTKVLTGTTTTLGNLFDKAFNTKSGSISVDKINKAISGPNNLVNNFAFGAIDAGTDRTKEALGIDQNDSE